MEHLKTVKDGDVTFLTFTCTDGTKCTVARGGIQYVRATHEIPSQDVKAGDYWIVVLNGGVFLQVAPHVGAPLSAELSDLTVDGGGVSLSKAPKYTVSDSARLKHADK